MKVVLAAESEVGQAGAGFECAKAYVRNAVGNVQCSKCRAGIEGSTSDIGDAAAQRERGHSRTGIECIGPNVGDSVGNGDG